MLKAKIYSASAILLLSLFSLSPVIFAETGGNGGSFSGFLIHPVMVTILLTIAILGLLLELFTPGLSVPGFIGMMALGIFFYSHWVEGMVGIDSIILLVIGLCLLLLELFLPFGVAGFLGLASILLGVLLSGSDLQTTGIAILIALTAASIGMVILVKFFGKRLQLFNRIILSDSTDTKSGYVSNANRPELIGQIAETATELRPSGTIVLGDERIDAVSEGRYIGRGKNVKIIKVEGSRIVVRELEKQEEE
ncbi:NfeD family protein [Planococcus sp. CAU13]|uniref:NfeD family protein n=1 Tax=Planococcus sp. CAU13 TaxID=1541197 RepID=UPI000A854877|nr:NfeD family protein [Planococcus sp. CAU13]